MDIFDILTMIGGLALFLFGMDMMGKGLSTTSGGRMERVLERMTGNIFKAVALGAGVTAVIQSSSATTVMVVGFVNSGIMKLSQAVGIIMGANIGTTVTSWILSLTGIESSNFFIRMLKPSSFSPILAVIGVIFIMFCKSEKKKDIGTILVGFAILMFGMQTMSDAVKPLADIPEFTNILLMFKNPLLGMLAGLLLTAVIQSSSASIGILQSLCATGAVTYGAALPIIMGQNIGTCVTALISSIGASKNAKRTAFVHLYFNVIGTVLFMAVFYGLNMFLHFGFVDQVAGAAGIAVIHTAFNVIATLVLLPFHKGLEKLAIMTVRGDDSEGSEAKDQEELAQTLSLLDERFLANPALAIANCREVAVQMAKMSRKAMRLSMQDVTEYDEERNGCVFRIESNIDQCEDALGTYLIQLSSKSMSKRDSRILSMLLHCVSDIERISDHAINVAEKAQELNEKDLNFSEKCLKELEVCTGAVSDILDMMIVCLEKEDEETARQVEPLRVVIISLNSEMKSRQVQRLLNGEDEVEQGFILSDVLVNYERVAGHCGNLAAYILQVSDRAPALHEYRSVMHSSAETDFEEAYLRDRRLYKLPETA